MHKNYPAALVHGVIHSSEDAQITFNNPLAIMTLLTVGVFLAFFVKCSALLAAMIFALDYHW